MMKEIDFLIKTLKAAYKKCIKGKLEVVEEKEGKGCLHDLVTNCDVAAEKYILAQIKKHFPDDNIVSEESNANAECKGRCWIIDPIDGTINFSHNLQMWCLQAAFVENGVAKCSVIYCPTSNELFAADENGATVNGKPLCCNNNVAVAASIINICDFVQTNKKVLKKQLEAINYLSDKCSKVKMFGSAGCEFACVAANRIDAYAILTNNLWDIVPGKYLCERAGCKIFETEIDGLKFISASTNIEIENLLLDAFKLSR